ncbi:MAG: PrsW family glutamic-type intramembrane protease [Pseudomonadota bacterium]
MNLVPIAAIALAPALMFLLALVYLDSYKLTSLRVVLAVLGAGAAMAALAYLCNGALIRVTGLDIVAYSRTVAPLVEETLKALIVVALFRTHRVGFHIDAAILGFAAGAGFGVVENAAYMAMTPGANAGTWIVRGLGTALMHGAVTAIVAVTALMVHDSRSRASPLAYVACLLFGVVLHAVFNQFFLSPLLSTVLTILVLPPLLLEILTHGQRRVARWLGAGFDADAQMLELLDSGNFRDSPMGRYLQSLGDRFSGPVVADILCYVRLNLELALRAKGLLMMRETGFDVPVDEETKGKFTEIDYLESSIGTTGLLAVRPMLHLSREDLWQMNLLGH